VIRERSEPRTLGGGKCSYRSQNPPARLEARTDHAPRAADRRSVAIRDHGGIRAHRTATLTRRDVTIRDGIRVTTVARTTADIAPRLTDTELVRLLHEARRNHDLPNAELTRLYVLCPRAADVYDSEEAPSRSIFQHAFKAFLVEWDFPIPEFEAAWHGFEVDAFYEDHKLIIELDGYRDHSQPDRFEADRERDALAIELRFDTLRITWTRLKRKPAELARQLRAILAARDPAGRR
jgi:hypothetical protein